MAEQRPIVGGLTDALTVGGYRLGSLVARATPAAVARGTLTLLAPGVAFSQPGRREMIERHLRRVDPALRGLALRRASQRAFDSYLRYYAESFRLPSLSRRYVDRMFSVDGFDNIERGLEAGNGVILALPHLGGWEWAGRWMGDKGHRLTVVVEALEPPELFEWFTALRRNLGMNVVPLGPTAAGEVAAALSRNEVVCLLCDRDIAGNGISVEFFGEATTLPAGPAMLGLRTGAAVLPTAVYFTEKVDGHHAVVRPPLALERRGRLRDDVNDGTALLARELELLIRRAPDQWHLFQPNWPSDPGWSGGPVDGAHE
ncbi:MAG: phosphatidylinositol mannoside acyltransferase [Ilumatobacteraceae bacterium]